MVGVYFSGTGNTKHCVCEFLQCCESDSKAFAIEDKNAIAAIQASDVIVFGYPIILAICLK